MRIENIQYLCCFCCCPWLKGRDNGSVRDQLLVPGEAADNVQQRESASSILSARSVPTGIRMSTDDGGNRPSAQIQQEDSGSAKDPNSPILSARSVPTEIRMSTDDGGNRPSAQIQQEDSGSAKDPNSPILSARFFAMEKEYSLFNSKNSLDLLSSDLRDSIKPGYLSSDDGGE